MMDLARFIDTHEAADLQYFIRKYAFEEEEDLFELIYSRMMSFIPEELQDDTIEAALNKLFSLAFDESMFRAICKPILKAIHEGPLSGEDRCFKMGPIIPKLAHSILLVNKYMIHCSQQIQEKVSVCWHLETNIDHSSPRRLLQHDIEMNRIKDLGYSIHLWFKPANRDLNNHVISLVRRGKLGKEELTENIIEVTIMHYTLTVCFPSLKESHEIELINRDCNVLSLLITSNGVAQVLVDGVIKLERKLQTNLLFQEDFLLNVQTLSSFSGYLYGYLTSYDPDAAKAIKLSRMAPEGVQTTKEYEELTKLMQMRNLDQILNPIFQGTQMLCRQHFRYRLTIIFNADQSR